MLRVLIANRGEIAVRIARTVRELGWIPITVYEEEDKTSPHVKAGRQAVKIDSYTNPHSIIDAALKTEADIIHPGYGFLSENPSFAKMVLDHGIAWAGPSPQVMALLADKQRIREIAEKLGVPVLPWCSSRQVNLRSCVEEIGYPVIVKAVNAGGGRGQRIVHNPDELEEALEMASREAGGGEVIVEKYINNARHIEVQILGDHYGDVIHLYERECSIQRRRQKIIEEAPSPLVEKMKIRETVTGYALRIAQATSYDNAGTIEFIYDPSSKTTYILESNTRLQVEHPVTELVTGIDIVKQQLLIAVDKPLLIRQYEVTLRGWAIEARIYAEDPLNYFTPTDGVVRDYKLPRDNPWIRIDHALARGLRVNPKYDTLLAKVIAWGMDRAEALRRLELALASTYIAGVRTNIEALRELIRDAVFRRAEYTTQHLEKTYRELKKRIQDRLRTLASIASRIGARTRTRRLLQPRVEAWLSYGWLAARTTTHPVY
ncbi:MAG: ATP-grasp domain-containing protein [Crenarchaeota archaeon]|nr:ATP-grasp domain-containing protein [Thermoproteota archaeon]